MAISGRARFGGLSAATVAWYSSCGTDGGASITSASGNERIQPPKPKAPRITAPRTIRTMSFMNRRRYTYRHVIVATRIRTVSKGRLLSLHLRRGHDAVTERARAHL